VTTLHKSLSHEHLCSNSRSSLRCLVTSPNSGRFSASGLTFSQAGGHLTPNSYSSDSVSGLFRNQSQSHIATDGQSVSKSWYRAPSRARDQIFIIFLTVTVLFLWAPSLTRGRVCLLYMLLAPASAVFVGSESLGTRDHILLSQI
jgi:hypothetical protein